MDDSIIDRTSPQGFSRSGIHTIDDDELVFILPARFEESTQQDPLPLWRVKGREAGSTVELGKALPGGRAVSV